MANQISKLFSALVNSVLIKILFIGFLIIILIIPIMMVSGLIHEREYRYKDAIQEVSSKWGNEQTIIGPILTVPYQVKEYPQLDKSKLITKHVHILPDKLEHDGQIDPEIRSRGIFDITLYNLDLNIKADYPKPSFEDMQIAAESILWDDAYISLAIPDLRGIKEDLKFTLNDTEENFLPSNTMPRGISRDHNSGIKSSGLSLSQYETDNLHFEFDITLNGSKKLFFAPLGKETITNLSSPWPNPSFTGNFLPTSREITEEGFESTWQISYYSRSFPQFWTEDEGNFDIVFAIKESNYGVDLLIPVDYYQQNTRSVKYGILFILLTFSVFFLFEIISKVRIHPLQYLLVGVAMCIFYLLLLSLSEHLGFDLSYIIASISTIALISFYSGKILLKKSRGMIMALFMTALYVYLFILLQQEDYALLIGSISLFLFLSVVMYLTRNIDWYMVKKETIDS